jgi:uncharacterized membrane protein YhhN
MKKTFLLLFFIALAADCLAMLISVPGLQYAAKPLLIATLLTYFILSTASSVNPSRKWLIAALLFSWLGDILLLFEQQDSRFFLFGLSAFLLAHLFYILFFNAIRNQESIGPNLWLLLPVVIYYLVLITLLSPYLGEMKLPVRVYGIVISFMLMLALHLLSIRNSLAGKWIAGGAVLFILSDTLLAINKFYSPFRAAGLLTIIFYAFAQYSITIGAITFLRKRPLRII